MADTKITALAAIATVDPAADVLPIVDISDTSMAASGTTKKVTTNQILQAGGTATLASATITGAATVGTTLGVTGVSTLTGNVGVGIAPTAGRLHVKGGASQSPLALDTLGYNQIVLQVSGANRGQIYADATNCFAVVNSAGSGTPLVVADTGNVSIANGNLVMSTSGKGIDFSAVTGGTGTATANVLNDYEEGTWVPTVGGTSTYTIQQASYIKVGRLVTVSFDMAILLLGTGSTSQMSGLPFVVGSGTSPKFEQCNGAAGYFQSLAVNVYSLTFNAGANGSMINSTSVNTLGGTANVNPAIYGNGTRVQGTVTYMAA